MDISSLQLVYDIAPSAATIAVFGVLWWLLLRASRKIQSRGLFFISLGFLITTVADGSWEVFYWSLGGPYYIVSLLQGGQSVSQASTTVALISWVGTGVYLGSLGAMVALMIYGANVLAETAAQSQLVPE